MQAGGSPTAWRRKQPPPHYRHKDGVVGLGPHGRGGQEGRDGEGSSAMAKGCAPTPDTPQGYQPIPWEGSVGLL